MAFDYRILKKEDETVLVTGHTQNVFTHRETGKIMRLPDKYYKKLAAMLE